MFLKYGVKSVSMDDIAKLLGISKKTIYALVPNKKDLVMASIEQFIKDEHQLVKTITSKSSNAIDEMVELANLTIAILGNMKPTLTYDLKKYYQKTWKMIESDHFTFIQQVIMKNVKRGIKEGYYRQDINPVIISKLYLGLAHMASTEQFIKTNTFSMAELYEGMVYYHINGIINEKGRNELSKKLQS